MPSHVGWSAISAVHCVRASTKTRSKNSSSGVTRPRSRSTGSSREPGWAAVLIARILPVPDFCRSAAEVP